MGTKALQRLGVSIGARRPLEAEEQELYETFIRDAKERVGAMQARLNDGMPTYAKVLRRMADVEVVGRVKTLNALADKLERSPTEKLPSIHDVAVVRIVAPISLVEQNAFGESLCQQFDEYLVCTRPALLVDRIESPSHGYRALHVIAWPEGRPVEIQIRTQLQHAWAQLMVVLGDRWGRELRYGLPLPTTSDGDANYRNKAVDDMKSLSRRIAEYEESANLLVVSHVEVPDDALIGKGLTRETLDALRAEAVRQRDPLEAAQDQLHEMLRSFSENLLIEQTADKS